MAGLLHGLVGKKYEIFFLLLHYAPVCRLDADAAEITLGNAKSMTL